MQNFFFVQNDKKDSGSIPHSHDEDKNMKTKNGSKDPNGLSNGISGGPAVSRAGGGSLANGGSAANALSAANGADDDGMKEEPPDFIETHCHWKDCNKEFNTPDELVKVRKI